MILTYFMNRFYRSNQTTNMNLVILTFILTCTSIVCFQNIKLVSKPNHRIHEDLWMVTSSNPQATLKNSLQNIKAKQLREILTSSSVSSKGMFDRQELEEAVIKTEMEWSQRNIKSKSLRTPLFVTRHGSPPKEYTSVDIYIRGQKTRFLIDSGSSVNLIKVDVASRLGLIKSGINPQAMSSQSVGGVGSTPSADALLPLSVQLADSESSTKLDLGLTFIMIQSLPTDTCGILGISFLDSLLGQACHFDYKNMCFEVGPVQNLLSPITKWKSHQIKLNRIFGNLLTCDVFVSSNVMPSGVKMPALVDLGAALTVANTQAARVLSSNIAQLQRSPTVIAGIDGLPIELKELPITKFALGEPDYAIDFTDSMNDSKYARSCSLLVCDFPAMKTVGLSEKPALILGHDLLHADYDNDDVTDTTYAQMGIDGLRRKNLVFDPALNTLYLGS